MKTTVDGFDFTDDDYVEDVFQRLTLALRTFGIYVNLEYDDDTGKGSINFLKTENDDEIKEQESEFFDVAFSLPKTKYEEFLLLLGIGELI